MECPACRQPMLVLELDDVEIDYCTRCQGLWLDAGELELLLGSPAQARKLLMSFREAPGGGEKPRLCPLCGKKMRKVRAGSGPQAPLLDACRHHEGLWFDRGELAHVIQRGSLDPDHQVIRLLSNMFAHQPPTSKAIPDLKDTSPNS